MTIIEKLKELYPNTKFIGGQAKLIVGPIGICFEMIHDKTYHKQQVRYKENDEINICCIKDEMVSVRPFLGEIWIRPDDRFKGIKYTKTK